MLKYYKILGITLLVYNLFITYQCNSAKNQSVKDAKVIADYKNKSQHFETLASSRFAIIARQEKQIVSNSKTIQTLLKEKSELNKINSQIKLETETTIKNIIASYSKKDTINNIIYDTVYQTTPIPIGVKFGTGFNVYDDWYSVSGKIKEDGVKFNTLSFKSDLVINLGYSRKNWYSRLEPKIEVIDNNPYSSVNSLNNLTVKEDKKWYQRPSVWLGIGIVKGIIITNTINK